MHTSHNVYPRTEGVALFLGSWQGSRISSFIAARSCFFILRFIVKHLSDLSFHRFQVVQMMIVAHSHTFMCVTYAPLLEFRLIHRSLIFLIAWFSCSPCCPDQFFTWCQIAFAYEQLTTMWVWFLSCLAVFIDWICLASLIDDSVRRW